MNETSLNRGRIGILTFLHTLNYGALLQAYALERMLLDAGYDAVQIDYRNPRVEAFEYKRDVSLKGHLANVIRRPMIVKKERAFEAFRRAHIQSTAPLSREGLKEACESFEYIVVGSDQVWNGNVTGFDNTYFLDFIDSSEKMRTYAVSIGQDELPMMSDVDYEHLIGEFPCVLVREQTAADALRGICLESEVEVVLDPTLLIAGDEWRALAGARPARPKGGYVFVYAVGETRNAVSAARRIAKRRGLKVVVLQQNGFLPIPGVINLFSISPTAFLSYIANAEFVVTSSFHGTCLAIQLERDFLVSYATDGIRRNTRMSDLLETLGLSDRVLSERPVGAKVSDWRDVRAKVNEAGRQSLDLLLRSLGSNVGSLVS